ISFTDKVSVFAAGCESPTVTWRTTVCVRPGERAAYTAAPAPPAATTEAATGLQVSLRVVLLVERPHRVDVDPDPEAGRDGLEQRARERVLAPHELRQLRDGDRRAGDALRERGDVRVGRNLVREEPVAFVEDVVVVRDRLAD